MKNDLPLVLLVDGDAGELAKYTSQLRAEGISNISAFSTGEEAVRFLEKNAAALTILNVNMPDISGLDLLAMMLDFPDVPVIVLTENNDPYMIVDAMKAGVFEYIIKSAEGKTLATVAKRALWLRELQEVNKSLKSKLLHADHPRSVEAFADIVTQNAKMLSLFRYIEAVADSNLPLLLTGETGVGKELFVRAIHGLSGRKGQLVPVNIAGLDDNALADTLFGHKKGAFTGAEADRKGLTEKAADGTLFLDEIGDLGFPSQVKLLRLMQEGEYYPLGSDTPVFSSARIVLATNRDLRKMQEAGDFRRDLYYRLGANEINIPPLRERMDDIPLLVEYFLQMAIDLFGIPRLEIPKGLFRLLGEYPFPGNVRELEGMIYSAAKVSKGKMLSIASIKEAIKKKMPHARELRKELDRAALEGLRAGVSPLAAGPGGGLFRSNGHLPSLREVETALIKEALARAAGNKARAAKVLGISRSALSKRLTRNPLQFE